MKKKIIKTISIIIIVLCVIAIIYEVLQYNRPISNLVTYNTIDTLEIKKNAWFVNCVADSGYVYKVTWDQKYGTTKEAYCKAIFKNNETKQVKLIAPWIDAINSLLNKNS